MQIVVSKEHIAQGECKSPQRCAIAQAIRDQDPTVSYVAVRTNKITVTRRKQDGGDGTRCHYAVPTKAARAIVAFDAEEEVKPFSFVAKLIDAQPIPVVTAKERKNSLKRTQNRRAKLKEAVVAKVKYGRRGRVAGV